jgi:tryptophan-rich sensory protein
MKKWLSLGLTIAVCQGAGLLGTIFTIEAIPSWYAGLTKPWFTPPNWLFGPMWVTLYSLMAIAVWRIKEKKLRRIFWLHLLVNAIWTPIFFGAKNLGVAMGVIAVLWIMIVGLIKLFWKEDKTAGWLLVPYFLWVSLASALNFSLWQLNK